MLAAADWLHGINFKECIQLALKIKTFLVLKPEELQNPDVVNKKAEHMLLLKGLLSRFDWLNTDKYLEQKTPTEIEKLKRIFLTTYQLLAELGQIQDIVQLTCNYEEKGKIVINYDSGCFFILN